MYYKYDIYLYLLCIILNYIHILVQSHLRQKIYQPFQCLGFSRTFSLLSRRGACRLTFVSSAVEAGKFMEIQPLSNRHGLVGPFPVGEIR